MPVVVKATTSALVVLPVRDSVHCPLVLGSAAFGWLATTVTTGSEDVSLSVILTDAVMIAPSAYAALLLIESVTVSVPSTSKSSIGVTASATLLCPAGMTAPVPSET